MNEKGEEFIKQCMTSNTSVSAFIKLFNLWDRMDSQQRGEVVESEIKKADFLLRNNLVQRSPLNPLK